LGEGETEGSGTKCPVAEPLAAEHHALHDALCRVDCPGTFVRANQFSNLRSPVILPVAEQHGQDVCATPDVVTQLEQLIGPATNLTTIDAANAFAENARPIVHTETVCQVPATIRRLQPSKKRRKPVVPTMLKRSVMCAMLVVWMLVAPGCGVKQSEYDAKVAEAKSQAEKVSQLQKDFDTVKSEIDRAKQARKKDAEARTKALEQESTGLKDRVKTLEQENAGLKDRVKTLEQENAGLKASGDKTASQLAKDIADAKGETAKAEQARKAAEAKIRVLEQETAELKKKPSKPLDFLKKK
jgi:hypothetical protein